MPRADGVSTGSTGGEVTEGGAVMVEGTRVIPAPGGGGGMNSFETRCLRLGRLRGGSAAGGSAAEGGCHACIGIIFEGTRAIKLGGGGKPTSSGRAHGCSSDCASAASASCSSTIRSCSQFRATDCTDGSDEAAGSEGTSLAAAGVVLSFRAPLAPIGDGAGTSAAWLKRLASPITLLPPVPRRLRGADETAGDALATASPPLAARSNMAARARAEVPDAAEGRGGGVASGAPELEDGARRRGVDALTAASRLMSALERRRCTLPPLPASPPLAARSNIAARARAEVPDAADGRGGGRLSGVALAAALG